MGYIQKLAITGLLLAAPAYAAAKEPPLTDEERTVVQVYEAPGFTKDQIFAGTKMWIAENFKSAKAVIEYENKEEGVVIGNGSIPFPCKGAFQCIGTAEWRVPFTVRAEAKDGRFRLTFTNVHLAWPARYSGGVSTPAFDAPVNRRPHMDQIRPKLQQFGNEIVANMGKAKASSDW